MLIADSHEFIELYRGDKDLRLGQEMVSLDPTVRFVSFAPVSVSPVEREFLGRKRHDPAALPPLPERMEVRLLPSAALRFARKEVGGVLSFMPGYGRSLARLRPDVVLENPYVWLTPRSYTMARVARRLDIPVVYYDPGDDVPLTRQQRLVRPFEVPVIQRAAAIITYNAIGRRRFITKYGYPAEKIHVIPKPMDVDRWKRPDLRGAVREELGIPEEAYVVAHSGRLTRMRGSMVLADAARAARGDARFSDVVFLFIGGPMGADTDIADYAAENTIVTGMVPNERVPGLLAAADVVVFPDLESHAGFTTAVAEAMAAARPLIIGLDPTRDTVPVRDGVTALLVTPGSVPDLLSAIAELRADPARAASLGVAVGAFAAENMDYTRVARAYLDILEGAVADAHAH